jgi:hypothetical protein
VPIEHGSAINPIAIIIECGADHDPLPSVAGFHSPYVLGLTPEPVKMTGIARGDNGSMIRGASFRICASRRIRAGDRASGWVEFAGFAKCSANHLRPSDPAVSSFIVKSVR